MIHEREWVAIRNLVTKLVTQLTGGRGSFITGRVIKNDPANQLVWLKELGSQPIPVVGFDYNVKYYDTDNTGTVNVKSGVATPICPSVGESVLVVLEMGTQSLPRCIGKFQGRNWIIPENE